MLFCAASRILANAVVVAVFTPSVNPCNSAKVSAPLAPAFLMASWINAKLASVTPVIPSSSNCALVGNPAVPLAPSITACTALANACISATVSTALLAFLSITDPNNDVSAPASTPVTPIAA